MDNLLERISEKKRDKKSVSELRRKLRYHQNTMVIGGMGIIALGIWMILKEILVYIFEPENELRLIANTAIEVDASGEWVIIFLGFFLMFVNIFTFAIHLYMGRRSILEGRGKDKKRNYLYPFVMVGVLFLQLIMLIPEGTNIYMEDTGLLDWIAMMFIDSTFLVILADTLFSVLRSRALLRKLEKMGE